MEKENKHSNLKKGMLVVPNNHVDGAFFYKRESQLIDGVDYRPATDSEYVYWYKYIVDSGKVQQVNSFQAYKEENVDYDNEPEEYADTDFANINEKIAAFQKAFGGGEI